MRHGCPRGYPVSTAGLSPIQRCIDLRRRAMRARKRRPIRLFEQMIDNRIFALSRRGEVCGGWNGDTGDGDISVFVTGGGFHRDCRPREYVLRSGRAIASTRGKGE